MLAGISWFPGTKEAVSCADVLASIIRQADETDRRRSLPTGIADLDALTAGGLEPGQLVIIGARPAVGKTALALAIARHVAQAGKRVVFASLEMSSEELARRLLSAAAGVPGQVIKNGMNDAQWSHVTRAQAGEWWRRLLIDDRPAQSVAHIRHRARQLRLEGGLALVVVDYLQLMTPADTRAPRTEQVGSLSRGMKALAKELGVPIVALAQLNRGSEARPDKKPQLSDLRDSGEVEQDADMVLLLSRASADGNVIECHLAKHRAGPTGAFWLDFQADTMQFLPRYGAPPEAPRSQPQRGFTE